MKYYSLMFREVCHKQSTKGLFALSNNTKPNSEEKCNCVGI